MTFNEFFDGLRKIKFPADIDVVVAIGTGGIVPGALVAACLGLSLKTMLVSFRGADNNPISAAPVVNSVPNYDFSFKKVLLVDDVVRSGATMHAAKQALCARECLTFAVNGQADFSIINTSCCVPLPWR